MTWHFFEVWGLLLGSFAVGGILGTLLYIGLAVSPLAETQLDVADAVHDRLVAMRAFFARWRTPSASYRIQRDIPAYVTPIPRPTLAEADAADAAYDAHVAGYGDAVHPGDHPPPGPEEWVEEVASVLGVADEELESEPVAEASPGEAAWSDDDAEWREGEWEEEEYWDEDDRDDLEAEADLAAVAAVEPHGPPQPHDEELSDLPPEAVVAPNVSDLAPDEDSPDDLEPAETEPADLAAPDAELPAETVDAAADAAPEHVADVPAAEAVGDGEAEVKTPEPLGADDAESSDATAEEGESADHPASVAETIEEPGEALPAAASGESAPEPSEPVAAGAEPMPEPAPVAKVEAPEPDAAAEAHPEAEPAVEPEPEETPEREPEVASAASEPEHEPPAEPASVQEPEAEPAQEAEPEPEPVAAAAQPAEPQLPPPVPPPTPQGPPVRKRDPDLPVMRPLVLPGPRNGVPDNLQRIRGIGKKNEELLNSLGIYHFAQIAAWTPAEAQWVANHMAFPERIERDDWVGQAIIFATGGDTGFAKAPRRDDDGSAEPSVAA